MADAVFIFPITGMDIEGSSIRLPLSILHAVNPAFKNGFSVKLIDQRTDHHWEKTLEDELRKETPLMVGISSMTGAQIKGGIAAAKISKRISPGVPVVWGGVHPSLLPEQTLADEHVDMVVIGEGEETLLELLEALRDKTPLDKVKGIGYMRDGMPRINLRRDFLELNSLPPLSYEYVDVSKYFSTLYGSSKTLSLLTGKGCPHRCTFCYNQAFNKRTFRVYDAERVISDIETLIGYGAEGIVLVDDNFFADQKRVAQICRLILERGYKLQFSTNCRIDYLAGYSDELMELLKKCNFVEFFLGVESGSDRVLKMICKDITRAQVKEVNRKMKKAGIAPIYSFMAGFPDETLDDINQTVDLMMELIAENEEAYMTSIKAFTPFPGTELFDTCISQGFQPPTTLAGWADFDYNQPHNVWLPAKLNRVIEKLSYLTYFLDRKFMIQQFGRNPVMKRLIEAYTGVVEYRCRKHFYGFTPELIAMRYLKDRMSKAE